MNSKPALESSNAGLELAAMKLIYYISSLYRASLGILVEIAYSAALIAAGFGIIFVVLILLHCNINYLV